MMKAKVEAQEKQILNDEMNIEERDRILRKRRIRKSKINAGLRYTVLVAVGMLMLYPLVWLIGASFKTNAEIFTSIGFLPNSFDFSGYVNGWRTSTQYTFATYFMNTFKIVIPKVILTMISTTITAYGFARFKMKGKKVFFMILIATLLLPNVVLRIPQYLMYRDFGWLNSYKPLVVPAAFATDAFFVFMMIQFMRGIPKDLEEAARIDGCNSLQVLYYILMPMLKPAIISVGLFQFMWTMNDFLGPLIYLSSVEKYPVSIALKMSMDASALVHWNQIIAMSVIALIPSLVVFFAAQRYFVDGISTSGIKG
ncbi:binding-protein-dependent transport systems inner membrane component [Alkaliphilus metalliredigens QYMF]|uniref:Binding-protein-dependent transport systems inner membrane component n=2 Tax=Alkaliphilus TaxID=114627 RepID=A6TLQ2_ALKMQ|nr:carbohydrate ABC transporter permease [Alkaliphilus metalliredigens]ABR47120.1 binding-protein-dependent transport systems inner membrane component [Alkaliphilus metalliredigens QYMF]